MRGWSRRAEHEARVVNAMIDYVRGKKDTSHGWPTLDEIARRYGWNDGFVLGDACKVVLGARPFAVWRECKELESESPIHTRAMRAW